MMSSEVIAHIKNNYTWSKLPKSVQQTLGNTESNWDKCVSDYCIKNQYRFKGSIAKKVRKDEKIYYQELIQYSRKNLMLYPYHLSDIVVKGLRLTPFSYYCNMMQDIMASEKSYDSLPNFTAADCLRLMGIGRNQYIEMMNQCKSSKRFFRLKRPLRELLPSKPIHQKNIETWWVAHCGYITDEDVKMCTADEVSIVDRLIDKGATIVKEFKIKVLECLYSKGLIYFDVPIVDTDYIVVPPLENFVMNRVLGDYMETMLYKVFVSVDEHTTVKELAQVLEIDLSQAKNAIALFCRLGLAHKKVEDEKDSSSDSSSSTPTAGSAHQRNFDNSVCDLLLDIEDYSVVDNLTQQQQPDDLVANLLSESDALLSPDSASTTKRIAFLFDSTLTAFLMMGNLSQGLKRHAVTMFEVGKLSDETMDSFIEELEKIENVSNEGEAQRYFDHAVVLKNTILYMRNNTELHLNDQDANNHSLGLDLVRCESMNSLDASVCRRILQKKYSLLVSMAPLSNEIRPITSCSPPHIGPAIPEVNSVWFKLFLYHKVKRGPSSLLLTKGTRLRKLPRIFKIYDKLLITTWGHDPAIVPVTNVIFALNDALSHSPVLVQAHGLYGEGDVIDISFPIEENNLQDKDERYIETVQNIENSFDLSCSCGYITLLNTSSHKHSKRNKYTSIYTSQSSKSVVTSTEDFNKIENEATEIGIEDIEMNNEEVDTSCWFPLQICYGIPLFDDKLNEEVTKKIISGGICSKESLEKMTNSNRLLSLELLQFIDEWKGILNLSMNTSKYNKQHIPHPTVSLLFHHGNLSVWTS